MVFELASKDRLIRLALIGCGKVSQDFHLPAVLTNGNFRLTALIDINAENAKALSSRVPYEVAAFDCFTDALPHFDAAIVATSPVSHARLSIELAKQSKHLLVEKPLALTSSDCLLLSEQATASKVVVLASQIRRYMSQNLWFKDILRSGRLGQIKSINIEDGWESPWNSQSDLYDIRQSGGGVLIDYGAHVLDLACWFFGHIDIVEYSDDSYEGVEAECCVKFRTEDGSEGAILLSKLRELRNSIVVTAEKGLVEIGAYQDVRRAPSIVFNYDTRVGRVSKVKAVPMDRLFRSQLDSWLQKINSGQNGLNPENVAWYPEAFDSCYGIRRRFGQPWMNFA